MRDSGRNPDTGRYPAVLLVRGARWGVKDSGLQHARLTTLKDSYLKKPKTVNEAIRRLRSDLSAAGIKRLFKKAPNHWGPSIYDNKAGELELTPAQELEVWTIYLEFHDRISLWCKFSTKGIGNKHERYRRQALCRVFRVFRMRRTDDAIRKIFQSVLGNLSMSGFILWSMAPAHYVEWYFDGIPRWSLVDIGKKFARDYVKRYPEYRTVMDKILEKKEQFLVVRRTMET